MITLQSHFSDLENKLLVLLNELKTVFSKDDYKQITEFIEHQEYGIAFEWICDYLYEEEIKVNRSLLEAFKQLAESMQMSEKTWNELTFI